MGRSLLSLSVLLVISVLWKPAFSDKCSLACSGTPTTPGFLNGHKYSYGVEGSVSVYLTGADKQETSVKLLGQVSVTALGNCVHELKVQNLVVSGPDGKKYPAPAGVDKPVRFTLQDGRVGSDICSEEGDTRRSLNIKRALITMLQSENKPSTQVDVFGACPTDVSSSQEGAAQLVHRSRDLSRCAYREQSQNVATGIYNPTAEIKATQVLQSTLNVESKVIAGVPEKVQANEEYLYKPFSVGENGARAKVNTKLTLTGKAAGAASGDKCVNKRTIIFEAPHGGQSGSNADAVKAALKDAVKTLSHEASSKSAGEFAQLIKAMRFASKDDLMGIFGSCKSNPLEKRVFLDGLLRAGSGPSVEASIDILKSKALDPLEQQLVFLSLGNARHVTDDAVKAAADLLDIPNPAFAAQVYLGVGALAGAYCRDHQCHHTKNEGILALTQKLAGKLQNCKPKGKLEEDNVVAALKGIRNIRHLEDSVIDKLVQCATDKSVKARVKVAALEAYSADPCATKIHKSAMDLMKNRQLDSEIRIKAYLAVIECPCAASATEIKNLLDTEPVHQVGRFITTSLRHIRNSANPDRLLQRQHYGQIRTPNKFNVDDRKYSFFREVSYNVDALGLGGNVEETVIYSQDSFLPRSASLNLTAEVFGHSLNILEIGGRQGNLDRVIEHFLGPKSFLRTENPQNLYDNLIKRLQETEKKVEGSLRGRRSIKSEVDNFDKHVKAEVAPYDNELDLDIYMKLFGTDAFFLSLGDDKGIDLNSILDRLLNLVNGGLDKAKHFQQELRTHLLFLDAELVYPTSTGFPLRLDLTGAATARLDVATNIDLRQILRSPKNAKIDVKLIPSSDVEISCVFVVDADAVSTGLKVITNLHSSTGGHLIAKVLEDGHGFDIQFGMPVEKQEILVASNDLVIVTTEKGKKDKHTAIKTDMTRKEYSGCFDQLSGLLGLTLCGEVSVPFSVSGPDAQASVSKFLARYPLTGSSKVKLVLEKNDLRGYHIKGVMRGDEQKRSFELLFEAEGSKNRRTAVTGEIANSPNEIGVTLALDSPIKKVSGQASYIAKPSERYVLLKANVDDQEYYAKGGFIVQNAGKRTTYKPMLEYQVPGEKGKHSLKVDGQLVVNDLGPQGVQYNLEGVKITMPSSNEVVDLNGHFTRKTSAYELDLKAKKGEHNMVLTGNAKLDKKQNVKLEFQNTLNPYINFKVDGNFENTKDDYHNEVELVYGPDLKSKDAKVSLHQHLKYSIKNHEDFNIITKNKFEIGQLPLKVKADAELDPKKVDIELEGRYMDKTGEFDLEARTHIKKPGDYSFKLNADIDKKGIEAFAKRDIVSEDKSNLENYVVVKGVGRYELSGVVLHRNKPNDVNLGAVGHLKISGSGKNEDIKFDIGVINTEALYSSHAKVSCSAGEILDYLLKINRGANPSGQLKFTLKDTIAANGQYKVTEKDGKGNGMIIIDFKKSQRKIKGDVKFVAKEPVFSAEVDLFLNFEKDNNDKVHFSTDTKATDKLVDTKNKIEYKGQKSELNLRHEGALSFSGKCHSSLEIVLPNERCLSAKLDRDVTVKEGVINGNVAYILSDAPKRGGPASTISYKGRAVDTDYSKNKINHEGQLDLKLNNGKTLQNNFYYKSQPDGEKMKFDFKTEVNGNLIPKPAALHVLYHNTGLNTKFFHDDTVVKANYGSDFALDLDWKYTLKNEGTANDKWDDNFALTVHLPFEKAHDIKIQSTVLCVQPNNGKVLAEYSILESLTINGEVYKVDLNGRVAEKEGNGKVKVVVPHQDPLTLESIYKTDTDSEKKKVEVEVKTAYGKGKTASIAVTGRAAPQEFGLTVQAAAPQAEKLKKLDIQMSTKIPSPDTYSASVGVDVDGQVYNMDSLVVYSKANPVFDIKLKCPKSAKPSRLYVKGTGISAHQGKMELKVENIRDVSVDARAEGSVQKDSVNIKAVANSPQLGWKDYKVDISSKDSGSGKRLEFHATNDGKNVFSGSTSFISKQEGPKTIVEGSGSVTVQSEQKSANFKYIRTLLTEGNEQGVEEFVNLAIGERSYVAEHRVTNLEYKTSYVYCEEKKQCANAELQSKINMPKPGVFQHVVNIGFDLRKLGFAPEFGLEVTNEVSEKRLPQYTLDLHVNKEDKKYYLHIYSQPEHGKFPAGITVTLPQRVLALESLVTYPTNKGLPFPVKGEVALYMDKKKAPNKKTGARFLVDVTGSKDEHGAVAEIGFSHPKLGKEALIRVNGKMQRPNENSLKIESAATISHSALGKDRETKFNLEVAPMQIKLLIDTSLVKVIELEGSAVVKDNLQQGDLKFKLLEGKPVQVHAIAKDFQYYEFTTGYSDEQERKLSVVARIEPEKRIEVTADIVLNKEKKNIAHGALFLQDNLVKSEHKYSKENYMYFESALQKDMKNLLQRIEQLRVQADQDLRATLNRVQPSLKQLQASYQEDLEKLYQEVSNDKTLKEIATVIHEITVYIAKAIDEITRGLQPIADQVLQTLKETSQKVLDMYEKQLAPQLKQLYDNLAAAIKQYLEGVLDLVAHYAAMVNDLFEKHRPEIQELANALTEIFKDITRLLVSHLKEFRAKASQILSDIFQQIKDMPIFTMLKEKIQELAVPEQALGMLQEAHNTIKALLPTDETKNFADALFNYVMKKLKQEKVDDGKELRIVYEKFAVALTSLVQLIRTQLNQVGVPTLSLNALPLFAAPGHTSAPTLGGSASLSILNQIMRGDLPDPLSLIRAYRPRSLNILDEVPAKLRAVVVNGQHIFTFDGRHLTFPGTCRYVLAHDFVDRNFTLMMQLDKGVPKSLILEDQSKTTVELKSTGQVALNGAAHGFPVMEKDVFAFKEPGGRIGLGSLYGLMVFCTSKLEVCYIEASGFYHGKLRGLLGDGNNEPYDDFRLPNGKISASESEFGNAYRLASSCAQVETVPHDHHQHHAQLPPACEQVFGSTSPLRPLGLVLDVAPFRQACIHAVTGDSANALRQACDLGAGYAALAVSGMLPAALPPACVQCTDTDTPKNIGDTYQVKVPGKQADIVVVVETNKATEVLYKEVAVPLVGQLVDTLKSKHVSDIKVYLVGVTSRFPYPIIYDADLKLQKPKVSFRDESRYTKLPFIKTGNEKVDETQQKLLEVANMIRIKLGLTNIVAGYKSIFDLPLRPGAMQHTISVVGEQCVDAFLPVHMARSAAYSLMFHEMPYSHSIISAQPIKSVGEGKTPNDVVGFSDDGVLLLGDKSQNKASASLRQTLDYNEDDACISFVEATGGLVLNGASYKGLAPAQQKQFLQSAASSMAQQMSGRVLQRACSCQYADPFRARSVCVNQKEEVATRRK